MTMNRLLTTIVQIAMLSITIPLLISVIADIKQNGFFPVDEDNE